MFKFLAKGFEGSIGIETTYNQCDKAIDQLRAYNADPNEFKGQKKEQLDEIVNTAIASATKLVDMEGERHWPGVFREMHKNLATIYFEQGLVDKVERHCLKLTEYGEVGRIDSEEIREKLSD